MVSKLILVDDHTIVRAGLKVLLDNVPDIEVVGEAENGRAAVETARKTRPDMIIMDTTMPELNGVDATRQILTENHDIKVLALTEHSEKRYVVGMLKAGARGYILKNCTFHELTMAIHTLLAGKTYLSPAITNQVLEELIESNHSGLQPPTHRALTPREREVLQLIAEGKPTKYIAAQLHVSLSTIETHRRQIMDKLKLDSIAELTKYAIREGLTSLEK